MILLINCTLFILFFGYCDSQVLGIGDCPPMEVATNFSASKYTGLWYEYERYQLIFEFLGKCVTATYTAQPDGMIGVFNEQVNSLLNTKQIINGTASFDGSPDEAKLTVDFPSFFGVKGSYWVLGTDYTSYAVVWSCTQIGYINFQSSWILTRERVPAQSTIDKAYEIINKNKLPIQYYGKTDQLNCPSKN